MIIKRRHISLDYIILNIRWYLKKYLIWIPRRCLKELLKYGHILSWDERTGSTIILRRGWVKLWQSLIKHRKVPSFYRVGRMCFVCNRVINVDIDPDIGILVNAYGGVSCDLKLDGPLIQIILCDRCINKNYQDYKII